MTFLTRLDAGEKGPREFAGHSSTWHAFVAFTPDGKGLAFPGGYQSEAVGVASVATGAVQRFFPGTADTFTSIAFSPDGTRLAAGTAKGRVLLWTMRGRLVHVLDGHKGTVWSLSFAADGKTLATAGDDGTARLWELATGRERARLTGHHGSVSAVAFAPDGSTLATGGSDRRALLWKLSELSRKAVAP